MRPPRDCGAVASSSYSNHAMRGGACQGEFHDRSDIFCDEGHTPYALTGRRGHDIRACAPINRGVADQAYAAPCAPSVAPGMHTIRPHHRSCHERAQRRRSKTDKPARPPTTVVPPNHGQSGQITRSQYVGEVLAAVHIQQLFTLHARRPRGLDQASQPPLKPSFPALATRGPRPGPASRESQAIFGGRRSELDPRDRPSLVIQS